MLELQLLPLKCYRAVSDGRRLAPASRGLCDRFKVSGPNRGKLHILLLHISISKRRGSHFQTSKRMKTPAEILWIRLNGKNKQTGPVRRHDYTSSYGGD